MAQPTEEDLAGLRAAMQMLQEPNAVQQAHTQRTQAQLTEQQRQGNWLIEQLNGAQKSVADAEARRITAEQQLAAERNRAMQTHPLGDTSKLGAKTPAIFDNDSTKWQEWSWKFRNHLAAANSVAREAMQFAEGRRAEALEEEEVERRGWKTPADQLYSSLVGFTTGESASIGMST